MHNQLNAISMTPEQIRRLFSYAFGSDLDFYEEYTIYLPDEEQKKFFHDNPEFMSEYPISREYIHLLKDKIYRGILRKIKEYNKS